MNQDKIWDYFQNEMPESFSGNKPRLSFLLKKAKCKNNSPSASLLNIGAGDGFLERLALARGYQVHSLDPSARAVEKLQKENIHAVQGDIAQLPFADSSFDFVIASEVLEHLEDGQRSDGLKEIFRVLKPGGWFLGTVPHEENLKDNLIVCPHCTKTFHRWGHVKSFNKESLLSELTINFSPCRASPYAFVEFKNRSVLGKFKSLVRWVLGRWGVHIAHPNLYFEAKKSSSRPITST